MRPDDYLKQVIAAIAKSISEIRHETDFSCGDCERQQCCNLEPRGMCVVLAIQLARDGGRSWKRDKARAELNTKSHRYYQA